LPKIPLDLHSNYINLFKELFSTFRINIFIFGKSSL
jgi:hypothetical protein